MKKDYIYVTYYQIMAFVKEYSQIREQNKDLKDELAEKFVNDACYAVYQASSIPKIIKHNIPIFTISISAFNYLEKLTSINIFDRKIMKEYKKEIIKDQKEFLNKLYNGEYDEVINNALTKANQKRKSYKK